MASTRINLTVDEAAKEKALELFKAFGMDASTAVNIYFQTVARTRKIPFEISANVPNAETLAAIEEMDDMLSGKIPAKRYSSVKELFEDLES